MNPYTSPHAHHFTSRAFRHLYPYEGWQGQVAQRQYAKSTFAWEFRYAVEVRNPALLGFPYSMMLMRHGAAHVYNHWSSMPPLSEQHTRMQGFTAALTVLRLLTPLKMSYAAAKKRAEPYTKIVEELPQLRQEAAHLARQAANQGRCAYVFNNRAEGNAPLTVQALTDLVRESQGVGRL